MKDIIQSLAKTDDEVYAKVGTVEKVDTDENTCDVIPLDGSAKIIDVYLQADSDNGGILQIPKVGSLVCVVFINKETAVIANTGEIDALRVKIKDTVLEIDQEGFLLKKENETLKKLMSDLLAAIKAMKFTTNNGPTINLINLQQFIDLENRFNQFLK